MVMELRTALMDEIREEDPNASGLQLLAQAQSDSGETDGVDA